MRTRYTVPDLVQRWIDRLDAADAKIVANWLDDNQSASTELIVDLVDRIEAMGERWDD